MRFAELMDWDHFHDRPRENSDHHRSKLAGDAAMEAGISSMGRDFN
jgi:hypothetical protein